MRLRRTALDRASFVVNDVRNFLGRVYEGAAEANVPFLASGLTFDALLAAIPFIFLLLSVAGYVLEASADRAQLELYEYLRRLLPAADARGSDPFAPAARTLQSLVEQRGTFSVLGIPLFIWFSTRLFGSLRSTLAEVFDIEDTRSWLVGKAHDTMLVLVTTLLFVLSTALSEGVGVLVRNAPGVDFLPFFIAQVLAFAAVLVLFVIVFRYVPSRRVRWDTAVLASLICALGFVAAKHLMGLYVQNMVLPDRLVSNATVGGALLFVLWMYYMCFVFLLGAQIAQVYELRRRQAVQRMVLR